VSHKIQTLAGLAALTANARKSGKRVAQCHGVFDLVHVGHIRHFAEARRSADLLIVTVTPDRYVNKGPGRPVFNEGLRLEALAALEVVDYVALNEWPTATKTIQLLRPHLYVKGAEYRDAAGDVTGKIAEEEEAIREVGGELLFTDDIVFSSSALLNRYGPPLPASTAEFLDSYRDQASFQDIRRTFEDLRRLRVVVVGETIIDEYQYCETMGKSGKEPILAARYLETERHAGGVLAIANHLASFTASVTVVSQLGEHDSHEAFIRERLAPSVNPVFVSQRGGPTILKRRFIETYPFQKLFEIYVFKEEQTEHDRREMADALAGAVDGADAVIVADYGHGLLEGDVVERLCAQPSFLSVNTQKNAGNHGFNTVSKYRRADFVSISEAELRLDARTKTAPLEGLIRAVADRAGATRMIVTAGGQGCVCYSRENGIVRVPALTSSVRDRVGAGDAVFAITSLLARIGAPPEIIGLVGNAAGAQAVGTVGNRSALDRTALLKHLQHLLK
jgi:rfaE bifunctional protein nucleotidyltransferase chain/domain